MTRYLKNPGHRVPAAIFIAVLVLMLNAGIVFGQEDEETTDSTSAESNGDAADISPTTSLTVFLTEHDDDTPTDLCVLKNADITISSNEENIDTRKIDESGKAIFNSLPRATISITVKSDDLEFPIQHSIDLKEENQIEHIRIKWPMGQLKINVFDNNNETPLPYCRVRVESACGDTYVERRTDENGALEASLPFGELKIMVIKTGWKTQIDFFTLRNDENEKRIELREQLPPNGMP